MRAKLFVLTFTLFSLLHTAVSAQQIKGLLFFGDSYTAQQYGGPTWAQLMAGELGLQVPMVNQAVSGNRSDQMLNRVSNYITQNGPIPEGWLTFMFIGTNDYNQSWLNPNPVNVVGNIETAIRTASFWGGRRIVVLRLPELWNFPQWRNEPVRTRMKNWVEQHNALLDEMIPFVANQLSIEIIYFDTTTWYRYMLENPARFGFTQTYWTGTSDGHFFWDGIHPGARVNRNLARKVARKISPPTNADANQWMFF